MSHPRQAKEHLLVMGCGFIGSHVAQAAIRAGYYTTVLTRSDPGPHMRALLTGADIMIGDAQDSITVDRAVEGAQHVLYCLGGLTPGEADQDPAREVSLTLPPLLRTLEALRRHRSRTLVYLSSGGTIYGDPRRLPVTESAPTRPIGAYGAAKLSAEQFVQMYVRAHGLNAKIIRVANVYGDRQSPIRGQGVIATCLHKLLSDEPVVVFGDGSIVRDYVLVDNVATVMLQLIAGRTDALTLNIGAGKGTSLNDLLQTIEGVTQQKLQVEYRAERPFDVQAIVLDISRARALLNFEPTPLEQGILATWKRLLQATAETPSQSFSSD